MYPLMKPSEIKPFIPEMERYKVSEVARSPKGFLTYYMNNNGKLNEEWEKKRFGYISRALVQYDKNPTYRAYLSLLAWSYMPNKKPV